jgi:hypothetical protein
MASSVEFFKVYGTLEDSKQALGWGAFGINDFANLILFRSSGL